MAGGTDTGGWTFADPDTVVVATGELAVAEEPHILVTPALGSCVGVAVWDPVRRRGGLAHVMLPSPANTRAEGKADRFASVAVPRLVDAVANGGPRRGLVAKIAGGATMFGGQGGPGSVGARNVEEVRRQLALLRVRLVAEDTGGTHARTMELHTGTGRVVVRSYRFGAREL